jgi:hypothetical protein
VLEPARDFVPGTPHVMPIPFSLAGAAAGAATAQGAESGASEASTPATTPTASPAKAGKGKGKARGSSGSDGVPDSWDERVEPSKPPPPPKVSGACVRVNRCTKMSVCVHCKWFKLTDDTLLTCVPAAPTATDITSTSLHLAWVPDEYLGSITRFVVQMSTTDTAGVRSFFFCVYSQTIYCLLALTFSAHICVWA